MMGAEQGWVIGKMDPIFAKRKNDGEGCENKFDINLLIQRLYR